MANGNVKCPMAKKKVKRVKGGVCQNPPPGMIGSLAPSPMRRKKPPVKKESDPPLIMKGGAFVSVTHEELQALLKQNPDRFVLRKTEKAAP